MSYEYFCWQAKFLVLCSTPSCLVQCIRHVLLCKQKTSVLSRIIQVTLACGKNDAYFTHGFVDVKCTVDNRTRKGDEILQISSMY